MRILQIVPQMNVGGVETGTLDLAKELVRFGHESFVVSAGGILVQALEEAGTRHIQLPVHKKSIWKIWRLSKTLRKIIREQKIEIVHARSRVPAWISFLAVRGTSARFLTTAHGYYRPHWGSRIMGRGEKVIAISQAIREHLIQNFHVPPNRIRLIHRGVDLKKFEFLPKPIDLNAIRIGILGRLTPLKGHEYFLRAMQKVVQRFPHAKGLIIGNASPSKTAYLDSLLKLKDELGLNLNIEFIPGTSEISKVMKELDLLVLATTTPEGFGRVLIEAQASGVPVIGTRVGGVLDILEHDKNGWLVPPADSEALAQAIMYVLKHPDHVSRVVHEARRCVEEKFHLNLMTEKTLKVYQELLKTPKILILKFGALGDIVLASPTVRALRTSYPNSEMVWLVNTPYLNFVRTCPYMDEVIGFNSSSAQCRKNFFDLIHEIKLRRFDMLIDLQNNEKSHVLGFLSQIPKRVGYARGGRGLLLTHKIAYKPEVGPVESQNRLLSLIDVSIQDQQLEVWSTSEDVSYIEHMLKERSFNGPRAFAALFPFSNARWATKRWGIDAYLELAKKIHVELDMIPIFIGGKEDQVFSETLKQNLRVPHIDLIGQTDFGKLVELLKKCQVFIGGDSAPLHVASAAGIPMIALFGPTDPVRHAPSGRAKVLTHPVPCAPCYSPICRIKTHDCLRLITVDEVFHEIKKILEEKDAAISS
jgi:lipopolysaccharide heptosyltransferase II